MLSFIYLYFTSKFLRTTTAPHGGAYARLQLLLENSKSKKGHNYVKKKLEDYDF